MCQDQGWSDGDGAHRRLTSQQTVKQRLIAQIIIAGPRALPSLIIDQFLHFDH
jgi:hypothetical protein